jgi:peptide/nickel transport system substrate-binding protein
MTAEDIVLNIERAADPETSLGQMAPLAREYDAVEAPDDRTVILRSSVPRLGFFDFLVQFRIGEPTDIDNAATAYGSGPYMLGEWRPGDQFDLQRFPEYWNPDVPRNDGMVWQVSIEPQTLVAQFDAGAQDVIPRPAILDFVRWRDEGTGQTYIDPLAGSYYCIGYNTSWAPFDDVRVRQALTFAFDKRHFTDTILKGTVGDPYSLPWLPASPAYEAEKVDYYTFDPERARQLLDAAGVGAFSPEVWQTTENPEMREMSEAWQQDVANLGADIDLVVRPVEVALFVETINSRPPAHQGIWFANSGRAELQPFTHFKSANVLWDWAKDEATGYGKNNTGYYSDRYNEVLTTLEQTGDPEVARGLYSQLNDVILEDNFISWIAAKPARTVMQNEVMGEPKFQPGLGAEHYFDVWREA